MGQSRHLVREQSRLYKSAVQQVFSGKHAEALRSLEAIERNGLAQADNPEDARATILDLKAKALNGLERYGEALAFSRAAIGILEKSRPLGHIDLTLARENLAFALSGLEKYDEAAVEAERIVAGYERAYGPQSPPVVYSLNLLAAKRLDQNRIADAAKAAERALRTCESSPSAENGFCYSSLTQLGVVRIHQGLYRAATPLLERALEIAQKQGRLKSRSAPTNIAHALVFLATAYRNQGRLEDALALMRRGVEQHLRTSGPQSRQVAAALVDLAGVEIHKLDFAAAERSSRRALSILDGLPDTLARLRSVALANLTGTLLLQKRFAEAEQVLTRAVPLVEIVMGKHNAAISSAYFDLARLRQEQGKFKEATELYARIESAMLRLQGADHAGFQDYHVLVGNLHARQNLWDSALVNYRRARDVSLKNSANWEGITDTADYAAYQEFNPFALVALTAARLAGERPVQRRALTEEALASAQHLINSKAGVALTNMAARLNSGTDALAEAIRSHQDLSQRLRSDEKELVARLSALAGESGTLDELRARIRDAKRELDALSVRIEREFPKFSALAKPKALPVRDIQRLLRPNEAMLAYLPLAENTLIWAVTRDDIVVRSSPLSSAKLTEIVGGMRKTLDIDKLRAALTAGRTAKEALFDLEASHELYKALIGPVEAAVRGKRHLLVVPGGPLTSLPFHLLISEPPVRLDEPLSSMRAYREAAWLVRRHAMSVLPSVQSLEALRASPAASRAFRPLIGFGDPIFDPKAAPAPNRKGPRSASKRSATIDMVTLRGGRRIDQNVLRRGLPPLPDTADELREVGRQLGASPDDLRLGANATVATVKQAPLDTFKIVYFATHGLVAGEVSGLAEPALALTLPAQATDADNGLLTATDIAQLRLDADWVVLSACNTAAGDKAGADGLSGLARAFFHAGARALLVSHWAVDSATTVKLTTRTFAALAKDPDLGRAEALQQSMLALIDDPSSPLNAYPGLWAPFIVAGEGWR